MVSVIKGGRHRQDRLKQFWIWLVVMWHSIHLKKSIDSSGVVVLVVVGVFGTFPVRLLAWVSTVRCLLS